MIRFIRRIPTREEARTMACPTCKASPGHPCVEHRTTGHYGKYTGHVREANHAARIDSFNKAHRQ